MKTNTSNSSPLVSIIIPLHVICDRFFNDLHRFDSLSYKNYELLIVSDKKVRIPDVNNVRLILTKRKQTGPAEKRDIALKQARGSICAFIDDDAYPEPRWLEKAIRHLARNRDTIAIGGPGVTPPDDSRMAILGGLVYESDYTSGGLKMRFISLEEGTKEIHDWPAYNLIIRTNIMKKVGGWGSTYYGGEDTFICLKMIPFGRMIYDPKVIVYHHRRPLFIPHLRQIFNVGMHRGYFFKHYPETSRHFIYFLPTLLTIGFWTMFVLTFTSVHILTLFLFLFGVFFGMALSTVFPKTDIIGAIIASFGIITTHMAYGIGFLKGLLLCDMQR